MEYRAARSGRQLLTVGTWYFARAAEHLAACGAPFVVYSQYYVVGDRSIGISRATCAHGLVSLSTVAHDDRSFSGIRPDFGASRGSHGFDLAGTN